ncbi:F-box protein CPR1-like [Rutidosis leptorrhynchoides]|uniref:F-box protein CPR1-like n=1 Tax=Rutidosis leptorrhynchoides TaxID=125765 RepID=UPI003A99DAAA
MASECSNTLPPEMITNILCRLPAKLVSHFRCVSKDWLSQLSSHKFIKNHENTLNQKHILLNSLGELSLFSIPIDYQEKIPTNLCFRLWTVHFHGCCNGLVSGSASFCDEDFILKHYICNPTTKEVVGLPESGHEVIDGVSKGQIVCGFDYVSLTDDYKVVMISDEHKDNLSDANVTMCVHVYSLRANTWKGIIDTPGNHTYGVGPGAFINGFLHWLEINENMYLGNITTFSLSDEKFNKMLLPKVDFVYGRDCKLVGIGGKLGLFLEPKGEVWLMNEYGVNGSWTKILLQGFNTISKDDEAHQMESIQKEACGIKMNG